MDRLDIDWGNINNVPDTIFTVFDSTIMIDAKDYGAVGDGITEDYNSIQNALNASVTQNKKLWIGDGTYKMNDRLIYNESSNRGIISIIGSGETILDYSGYTGEYLITLSGSTSIAFDLSSAVIKGDTMIYSVITGSQIGDVVRIYDENIYWKGDSNTYKGELHTIKNITDTTIIFNEPIHDNYPITSKAYLHYCPSVNIEDVNIIGNLNYNQFGLQILYSKNITISNIVVENTREVGIEISYSKIFYINNVKTNYTNKSGTGYGVAIISSDNGIIENSNLLSARHGITIQGAFPSRKINIIHNILSNISPWAAVLDCHPGSEYINIAENICYGSIKPNGINISVRNNQILLDNKTNVGIDYSMSSTHNDYCIIDGNIIKSLNETASTQGILVAFYYDNDTIDNLIISNNRIYTKSYPLLITRQNTPAGCVINNLAIKNNEFISHGTSTGNYNVLIANYFRYDNIIFQGNTITSNGDMAIIFANGDIESNKLIINDNIIKGVNNTIQLLSTSLFRYVQLSNNNIDGDGVSNKYIRLYADTVILNNNIFNKFATNSGVLLSATTSYLIDNIYLNCSGNVSNTATNKYLGWLSDKANYYAKTDISTSGSSNVHSNNLTNWSLMNVSTDSLYLTKIVNLLHNFSQNIDETGGTYDTLVIRVYSNMVN